MTLIRPLTDQERLDWWRLIRSEGIGPITFAKLIERYGTAGNALQSLADLSRRGGRSTPLTAFDTARADAEIAALHKCGARLIAACEPDYPELLRQVDDAPPIIVMRGLASTWARPCVGMVGARNASLPGRKMAHMLARDLGAAGYTVVSGLARGVDTAAHEGSLATGTVAVVAGGIDVVYPPENQKLYDHICATGAVISEHPAGLEPKAPYFPRRNRIISGMSRGVCVVEATLNSGSLITARAAAEQGRDVFAVPGSPLDPRAGGPNALIRDGAVLVERADHITAHLTLFKTGLGLGEKSGHTYDAPAPSLDDQSVDRARAALVDQLTYTPVMVDEVARACQLNIHLVQAALLELELAGIIERLPGNRIVLIDKDFLFDRQRSGHS